ncbi:MAG: hypothetical protein DYG83_15710 [Candidatus Brocadia sp. AMX2]|nr:MAG: hypothetical protein EDM70_06460 [Candidatus Brocadia sp. AMX2]MBC6933359.1 hypothetical protein [Candidatus Brocadia sp.]MBL1169667.1 hypothetical protein [Candidatus Brocadia sp. AMX1]GIK13951.1 MAG: hypothetical protein BroJett002_26580 [Candidatus Brocadia sinica]MCE7868229.1 hypothetical protein [Candidatus Brocadia sp. AMX2]
MNTIVLLFKNFFLESFYLSCILPFARGEREGLFGRLSAYLGISIATGSQNTKKNFVSWGLGG